MKRYIVIALLLAVALPAIAREHSAEINVGTFNVWGNRQRNSLVNKEKKAPAERLWENSRDIVAQMIIDADWDIFGVQEGGNLVREELPKLVKEKGGKYKWWFQRPDPSISDKDDKKNLANGMVWRSDRFKVSNKQVYWLSPTPDTPSKAWNEKVRHWRFVMSANVKDKKSGLEFIFMVTHCPLMKSVNEKCAKLIVEREKGIIVATSIRMMTATKTTYSGCATYAGPITLATWSHSSITTAKNNEAATMVAPQVVANTRRLPR